MRSWPFRRTPAFDFAAWYARAAELEAIDPKLMLAAFVMAAGADVNHEHIRRSSTEVGELINVGAREGRRLIEKLVELGLLECSVRGGRNGHDPSEYRLTSAAYLPPNLAQPCGLEQQSCRLPATVRTKGYNPTTPQVVAEVVGARPIRATS